MSEKLFVYGTLMFPEVFKRVAGYVPVYKRAVLKGYHRYMVRDERGRLLPYPAVSPRHGHSVSGCLVDVNGDALARLDEYEADEYARRLCPVWCDGSRIDAYVYVWNCAPMRLFSTWKPPHGSACL